MKVGISGLDLIVNSPKYLTFVDMVLLSSFQNLLKLKQHVSLNSSSKNELKYRNLLNIGYALSDKLKLDVALHYFEEGLTQHLQ